MSARVAACVLLLACSSFATADDAEVKKAAKAQAEAAQGALLKGDYDKFAGFTHPKILEAAGGRKKMIEKIAVETKKMNADGVAFKSVVIGDPSDPIKGTNGFYVAVPQALEITVPGGRLLTKGTLVGVSTDNGKTWTFADAAPGRDALRKFFPDLPDALMLPKKEPPTFVKD